VILVSRRILTLKNMVATPIFGGISILKIQRSINKQVKVATWQARQQGNSWLLRNMG